MHRSPATHQVHDNDRFDRSVMVWQLSRTTIRPGDPATRTPPPDVPPVTFEEPARRAPPPAYRR
ncbi:hypothetical protein ACN27G_11750 [Plantactinospora sp. WMMB334]|uniref:hypothetical protein n=1 Tax=Plantactinospora sp. WMMB334 TaxID=3404119 RepID=UPI003B929BD8